MNGADDVDDGIKGSDLVEMDLIGGHSVDRSLHLTKSSKQRLRPCFAGRAQPRTVDERVNFRERSMRMRFGCHAAMRLVVMFVSGILAADEELRRADSRAPHTLDRDCIVIDGQAAKRRLDI